MNHFALPVGYPVDPPKQRVRPHGGSYEGRYVSMSTVKPQTDAAELYECSHGNPEFEALWTYMPYGPFTGKAQMKKYLENCAASSDPMFFTITEKASEKRTGVVSFLNIAEEHQTLELGHIWYSPRVQGTMVNTETIYLMLCESFDRLNYRRVEWKCNALNARSRLAAQRLGFSFEGIFYKHFINKNRNRDTAWFAMLDDDWGAVKPNMEKYLYQDVSGFSLKVANKPLLRAMDTGEASVP